MNPATVVAALQLFMSLVSDIPELVAALAQIIKMVETGVAPDPATQADIDSALAAAHDQLQKS